MAHVFITVAPFRAILSGAHILQYLHIHDQLTLFIISCLPYLSLVVSAYFTLYVHNMHDTIYIFHLACAFIIYFFKCIWVFWTTCVTMHHVWTLCLWKLEEGNRSPKLELQLIVSHHVVLGPETRSSDRVASGLRHRISLQPLWAFIS